MSNEKLTEKLDEIAGAFVVIAQNIDSISRMRRGLSRGRLIDKDCEILTELLGYSDLAHLAKFYPPMTRAVMENAKDKSIY